MLSSKAKYALRAALYLTENAAAGSWLQTADVAEQKKVPRKFLEAIFVQLRDHGIVESRRGAQGGHRLSGDPASITVADVIRVVDGPLALTPCASRTRFRQCADCVDISQCQLHPLMLQARDAVASVLEHCTLAQLTAGQGVDRERVDDLAPGGKRQVVSRRQPRRTAVAKAADTKTTTASVPNASAPDAGAPDARGPAVRRAEPPSPKRRVTRPRPD